MTQNHVHILEANLAEYAIQIWSPPSGKHKNANIQCQTNFKSLLNIKTVLHKSSACLMHCQGVCKLYVFEERIQR